MTSADVRALLPLIVLTSAPVLVMLVVAFTRNHRLTCGLTVAGLIVAAASMGPAMGLAPREVTPLFVVDGFGLVYLGLILAAALAVTLLAYGYLEGRKEQPEEFYLLVLLATLGAAVLVIARHFASFLLGLEILSVSLYGLIAYDRTARRCVEAGLKYLVLAAASDAFLLFGMALIYAETGSLAFSPTPAPEMGRAIGVLYGTGLAMMITGIGFKLAVVPFHLWTPDVYQGAPAPVTAFVATVSKGAMFALMFRYLGPMSGVTGAPLFAVLSIIAIASMFVGNLTALLQNNVKRILAYSSIAHLGYLLVAFLASRPTSTRAVTFYLVAYFVTTLGAFGIVTILSTAERDADSLDDYRGLFWRRPWLAGTFTAMLLSLAGIPLTAGFIGKFFVMTAGVGSALWLLVTCLVVNSVIGIFYYTRVLVAMFSSPPEGAVVSAAMPHSLPGRVVLAVLLGLLFWLGVYPNVFLFVIEAAVAA